MLNPALVVKIASALSALILIPSTTYFIHRYVKQGKIGAGAPSKALLEGPHRLPQDVIPLHYQLSIKTIIALRAFEGRVKIEIECKNPTKTVVLHAKQLIILDSVKLYMSDSKKQIKVRKVDYSGNPDENPNDLLMINLSDELKANSKYYIEIMFGSVIKPWFHPTGIYLSSDQTRKAKDVVATCFFPAEARTAFPCFDEPSFKAEFTIKLGCDGGVQTVSNMPPGDTSRDEKDFQFQSFEKTPRISPHQVGFVVGELSSRMDSRPDGSLTLRTWTLPASIGKIQFLRNIGLEFIEYYETFFDVKYPLRQMNLVILPVTKEQVRESYGLITLSEKQLRGLMVSETLPAKYNAALVYSHKLAHQWMGCLVTMKWWSDYWLIDSFAFFVRTIPMKKFLSGWDPVMNEIGKSMVRLLIADDEDNYKSTPIYIPEMKEHSAKKLVGSGLIDEEEHMAVHKGSLLFRMLYNTLGQDVFKAGISAYLKKFSFKVSEPDDLWAAFNEAAQNKKLLPAGVTVKQFMDMWIMQAGYPIIEVTKRNNGQITITHKRYLSTASSKPEVAKQCWWIPVRFHTASKPSLDNSNTQWLGCDSNSLTIETGAQPRDWIILNRDNGVFRVNYDSQTWEQLTVALSDETSRMKIDEVDRTLLVSDALALADSGHMSYAYAIKVLRSVSKEVHYLPWYSAFRHLELLDLKLLRTDLYDKFKNMMKKLLGNIYSVVKKEPTGIDDDKLLDLIKKLACKYDVGDCVEGLMKQYAKWKVDHNTPIKDGQELQVYCEGLKRANQEEWDEVLQYFMNGSYKGHLLLVGLTCTTDHQSFNKLFTLLLEKRSGSEMLSIVAYIGGFSNRQGYNMILNFVLNNFEKLKDYFQKRYLTMIFMMLGDRAALQDDVDKLKDFASSNKQMAAELELDKMLKTAEQRVAWVKKNHDTLSAAIDAF